MKFRPDRLLSFGARDPHGMVRRALLQFVARAMIATAVVAAATVLVAQRIAADEALEGARVRGETFAKGVAAPLVNDEVMTGDPRAIARFETVMRHRLQLGSISHMKLWSVDGRVLWSDEETLIGHRFTFPPRVQDDAGGTFTYAERATAERADHATTAREVGDLYEVYVGTRDAEGVPVVFETYWSPRSLHVEQQRILWAVAPVSLGALLLLLLAVLPLGVSLAGRLGRSINERTVLLRRSEAAADLERRRIAQTLHDGVIQDLAGLSYGLRSLARRVDRTRTTDGVSAALAEATVTLKGDLSSLRSLLTETYPPAVDDGGLFPAVQQLADRATAEGVLVHVHVDARALPVAPARAAYRVVREGLLNVVRHADARNAWVRVVRDADGLDVLVADDGAGGDDADGLAIPGLDSGHLGLRLLHDGIADLGGSLELAPRHPTGTVLRAHLPLTS
ncbi:MAG: hypothetical protein HOQ22_08405 [Nocardioidaceae bacterium]|nr:hypothetical protein [Nocardioidaceae bacterium]NUS51041.1 hypothetical protein [Nocardioidaceae bacterium]